MVKGSDSPAWGLSGPSFFGPLLVKESHMKKQSKKKDVIAFRKSCKAQGTGLSHYILMDRKAK
jgi:modified peptide precursor CbpA